MVSPSTQSSYIFTVLNLQYSSEGSRQADILMLKGEDGAVRKMAEEKEGCWIPDDHDITVSGFLCPIPKNFVIVGLVY